jgi:hypothetical protein
VAGERPGGLAARSRHQATVQAGTTRRVPGAGQGKRKGAQRHQTVPNMMVFQLKKKKKMIFHAQHLMKAPYIKILIE